MKIQLKINGKEIPLSEEITKEEIAILIIKAVENKQEFKNEDKCYRLCGDGAIVKENFNNYCSIYLKMGILFKTQEEAEKKRDEMKAIERVKKYIRGNFAFELDWNDQDQAKWHVCYNYTGNKLNSSYSYRMKYYSPIGYLGSEADCKQLIRSNKEDLEIIFK